MVDNLIYDVGMHNGDDTVYYLRKGYKVVSIEADPTLVEKAKQKFSNFIRDGQLIILNCGITKETGFADFFINEVNAVWNSFDETITSRDHLPYHKIQVPCFRFRDILQQYGVPYYLKIDIEGNDYLCVADLDLQDLPTYVSVEATSIDLLTQLYTIGYTKFKCIDQHTLLPMVLPTLSDKLIYNMLNTSFLPVRLLRRIGFRQLLSQFLTDLSPRHNFESFPQGSSGAFGHYLEGEWQTYEEIKKAWLKADRILNGVNRKYQYGLWCDFHACK
jgi:FkbM family methyltransferase